jgi:hypothetical protein
MEGVEGTKGNITDSGNTSRNLLKYPHKKELGNMQ